MSAAPPSVLIVGQWTVDPSRTTAAFRVRSLGRIVTGTIPVIDGTVDIQSDGRPSAISGSLDLSAIDSGNAGRDRDLRKPRLLDIDRHPVMTFAAETVTDSPGGWQVTGHLTLRGSRVRLTGTAKLSAQDRYVILTAATRLDLRELGIRAPGILIGHRVGINITAAILR
jgi:polyisoprenoid-binding protein YceI